MKEMPKFLYRYRKPTQYYVDDFCNDNITGSLYSSFKEQGELNYCIKLKHLLKYGITKEAVESFEKVLIDNCASNYYMACFSKTNPLLNSSVRDKFAGQDGFCIVYSLASIKDGVANSFFKHKVIELLEVNYCDSPYDLSPALESLVKLVTENKGTQEELDARINTYFSNREYSKEVGECVVKAFGHKKTDFKDEKEMRLVLQKPNHLAKRDIDHPVFMKIIPIKVYISIRMNVLLRHRIIYHAKELGIEYEFIRQ